MKINPKIKLMFAEIATESIKLSNKKESRKRYIAKLVRIYQTQLTEEERIYLTMHLLEQLDYRSIITDPDNIVQIHNLRLRSHFFYFILTIIGVSLVGVMFGLSPFFERIMDVFTKITAVLTF